MIAGHPKLNISFQLDVDGILSIEADEERSNKHTKLTVNTMYDLSMNDIKKNIMSSIKNNKDDIEKRSFLQTQGNASIAVQHTERILGEVNKNGIEKEYDQAKKLMLELKHSIENSNSPSHIKNIQKSLEKAMESILQIYML
ncbi:Hsp70 family protein [Rickettsiales bacterium]|nr:Hsp70 family protein [Rickettsiales bacterium]